FDGQTLIEKVIDEGAVRAVLQQAAYQIGQQVRVAADRCVNPHRQLAFAKQLRIKQFAHAVQALQLEGPLTGQFENAGNGGGIVGGELRVDAIGAGGEQSLGADQVG